MLDAPSRTILSDSSNVSAALSVTNGGAFNPIHFFLPVCRPDDGASIALHHATGLAN
jgi:hypothetical protein